MQKDLVEIQFRKFRLIIIKSSHLSQSLCSSVIVSCSWNFCRSCWSYSIFRHSLNCRLCRLKVFPANLLPTYTLLHIQLPSGSSHFRFLICTIVLFRISEKNKYIYSNKSCKTFWSFCILKNIKLPNFKRIIQFPKHSFKY